MELDSLSADKLQTAAKKQASWAVGALRQFADNRCAAMAAGIAFYAAFSLAPTLVMVIAVSGWFFGAEAARGELFRQVHSVLGNDAAAAVTTIVQNAHRSGGSGFIAAIISFVLLSIGASATFSSLNSALNIVWPSVAPRTSSVMALVRVRLISFGLVLGVAFLLIVSLVLDTAITFIGNWIWGDSPYVVIGNLLQLAVGWMVLGFAFAALLKFLPDAPVRWRDALVGGTVAAALFTAGKKLFALYLAHAGMANSFGAAGSLAVLLMWLYFSAVVLLLGAEFAAARGRMHDPRGAWGFAPAALPGSRAMLASALAASTVAADAKRGPVRGPTASSAGKPVEPPVARASVARRLAAKHDAGIGKAVAIGRTVIKAETQATRAAAQTLVEAKRRAVVADRYVRRHPWESMLIAASTAMALAAFARRRIGQNGNETPHSDQADH
ncbi:YihY/virulence factor BrkB family protein [Burkholderia sp. Ac-20365]|jgi:membrane protein|uniref:YihY/virulence factor BrkB family protein n=1 Tax=Burkholderia sp. Ac-20365 TaxID=2703897 RepID=UPI00197C32D2|nr:YihY/virulence factor BrkB family protein [Burkholderia sp. Ac-20365]MBN3761725.1 YihY/virulence factor BrkB family protein [Burkholderia sp. Ac-20365]